MPNAILRAGPFASLSDSFLNEQNPLIVGSFADVSVYPVNCANDTSSSAWPWRYNDTFSKTLTIHTGCEITPGGDSPTSSGEISNSGSVKTATGNFSASNSASSNRGTTITTGLSFAYQATQSFQIKITYNGSASASDGQTIDSSSNILFSATGEDPIEGFPSLSGSITRTLPASTVPVFFNFFLNVNIGIELPDNICIPNTGSANASSTLGVEFL